MNKEKLEYELHRLVSIMEKLRGPDGCPWDKKQTLQSLKPYIIEETYEVVEALQKEDMDLLKEELGDVLLQIIFQSQIAREKRLFDLIDIIKGINDKLIRRHPHVFSDREADTPEEVNMLWNEIKKTEKKERKEQSILDGLSSSQPALNQAYEMQKKVAEVGFDWDDIQDVISKIREEIDEVEEAVIKNDIEEVSLEIGDLLLAVVNLARFKEINPEVSLFSSILKFRERFKYIEKSIKENGDKLEEMPLEVLDHYWEEAKKL